MTRVVAGGRAVPSGLVLFAVMPMTNEEVDIDALVTAARDGALPGLAVALVPALLAARSVLRPVRELRRAAHSMGGGQLDTRIAVRGRDEMAALASTFNESAARLEHSVQELQDAGTRARRFASDVSHELRTPLAGMLAVTDVLDEDAGTLDPDTARAVRLISAETGKLAMLVEDLMEISRFDARAVSLVTDEVDAAEAVRSTLSGRQWLDRIRTELPEGFRIRLDPRRFDVIVANLVGNALRHGAEPVTVRLSKRGGALIVEVHDNGPGIAPDALPHIFDRFYKADAARARSSGSGLGLAITEENVRLHGGTIHARNAPEAARCSRWSCPSKGPRRRPARRTARCPRKPRNRRTAATEMGPRHEGADVPSPQDGPARRAAGARRSPAHRLRYPGDSRGRGRPPGRRRSASAA
ncbi:hypothetical protein Smic_80130 [Streptomyces microflavus]|uniref:Signal transduction histidine-protein kinase/phosphatase MprB n=1 Tax=Streptomyces microflavus TaxID=1919 RepID=A0A7J0D5Y1_STRMI|nr:hypothetical protein Smic_80130 [Streptomyces microflavus]